MPILGVIASSYAQSKPPSFESIATATISGSSNTVTFNSFGSGFTHLQIRLSVIASVAGGSLEVYFNGASGNSSYSRHRQVSSNGTLTAAGFTSTNRILNLFSNGVQQAAPSVAVIDIYDAFNTNKAKSVIANTGSLQANGNGSFELQSGSFYASNAAINSITLTLSTGNFAVGSNIALYGIKVAS